MSNFNFYPQMCHKGKVDFQLSEGLGWWWWGGILQNRFSFVFILSNFPGDLFRLNIIRKPSHHCLGPISFHFSPGRGPVSG